MFEWLNIELTSKCQRDCHFCGRAKARKEGWETGSIDLELFNHIISQFEGSIAQFNKDGEPLLYDNLWAVGQICKPFITNIVTNGLLLFYKRESLVNNFNTVTVSVMDKNEEQFESVREFIKFKQDSLPVVYIKFLGDYYDPRYEDLGLQTMRRNIHNPESDTDYKNGNPPIPEVGVCLDFIYKPSIDWRGNLYICNRFDIEGKGIIGNLYKSSLKELWNSDKRLQWLEYHKRGRRDLVPLCKECQYWGYPANA